MNTIFKQKVTPLFILLLLLVIGAFLRMYQLSNQGYIFYDEAAMVIRAGDLREIVFSSQEEKFIIPQYLDTKVLWIMILSIIDKFFAAAKNPAHYFSALSGVLTILLTFQCAKTLFKSKDIGLLSAGFLSISSYHVFYSRLAMPESFAGLLCIYGLYIYLKSLQSNKRLEILAGLIFAAAILSNRFRVVLFPFIILLIEVFKSFIFSHKEIIIRKSRPLTFLFVLFGSLLVYEGLLYVLAFQGIYTSSYFKGIATNVAHHPIEWSFSSFLTYPFYIIKYEGLIVFLLFLGALFFTKEKKELSIPLGIVIIQIIFSSFIDEKPARSLSVVLPFLSMSAAYGFYALVKRVKRKEFVIGLLLVVFLIGLSYSYKVTSFKSDMQEAVEQVYDDREEALILTTNAPAARVYGKNTIKHFRTDQKERLKAYLDEGYNILIISPQKYIMNTRSGKWNEYKLDRELEWIEGSCDLLYEYPHFKGELIERYLYEHTRPDLRKTKDLINKLNNEGTLKIYDLKNCK